MLLNYSKHFNTINLSDFTCTSSDNKKFYTHRVVLASQSPVFDRMFTIECAENKSRILNIADIDGVILHEMLKFMYTGRVEKIHEHARDLLYVANKYDIKELKQQCITVLIKKIKITNIFDLLVLADKCNAQRLIYECLQFIVK